MCEVYSERSVSIWNFDESLFDMYPAQYLEKEFVNTVFCSERVSLSFSIPIISLSEP